MGSAIFCALFRCDLARGGQALCIRDFFVGGEAEVLILFAAVKVCFLSKIYELFLISYLGNRTESFACFYNVVLSTGP